MLRSSNATTRALSSAVLGAFILAPLPALALDGDQFGMALKESVKRQGVLLDYASASVDGSTVILSGLELGMASLEAQGAGENARITVPDDVRFENVQEFDGGGYKVGRVGRDQVGATFSGVGDGAEDVTYSIGSWAIEGLSIPGESQAPELRMARAGLFYDRVFMENFELDVDGNRFITIENAQSVSEMNGDDVLFDATMDGFNVDLTLLEDDPDMKAWIEGTGYRQLDANYFAQGKWNVETGALDMPKNTMTLQNMGELNMDIAIGGYTPAFVESMQDISQQMSSSDPQQAQAASMQILGLVSQLSFGRFVMSYTDAGMTNNLLEHYAVENGTTRNELVAQIEQTLPLVVGQLGAPELQGQIVDSVKTFLNDPKSFTLSLAPDTAVAFPVLMGAAMSSPAELANALNATVRANN